MTHLLVLPRGGRRLGLRVQRGHIVLHVVVVERPRRRLVCPRLLEPAVHGVIPFVVVSVVVEPGVLVPGELKQGGTMDALCGHAGVWCSSTSVRPRRDVTIVFHDVVAALASATRFPFLVAGGGVAVLGLLQVHLLDHRLPQPHPRVDEPVRNL